MVCPVIGLWINLFAIAMVFDLKLIYYKQKDNSFLVELDILLHVLM